MRGVINQQSISLRSGKFIIDVHICICVLRQTFDILDYRLYGLKSFSAHVNDRFFLPALIEINRKRERERVSLAFKI